MGITAIAGRNDEGLYGIGQASLDGGVVGSEDIGASNRIDGQGAVAASFCRNAVDHCATTDAVGQDIILGIGCNKRSRFITKGVISTRIGKSRR